MDLTLEERYHGVVKKVFQGTPTRPAHGFVDCEATAERFGRDVFLHDQLVAALTVGQPISFAVNLNAKGMPQAVEVVPEGPAPANAPAPLPQGGGGTRGTQQGAAAGAGRTGLRGQGGSGGVRRGAPPGAMTVPTGQRLGELLLPAVSAALQNGGQQSVAAAIIAAAELLGVGEDLRWQVAAQLPQGHALAIATPKGPLNSTGQCARGGWRVRPGPYSGGCAGTGACGGCGLGAPPQGPYQGVVKTIAQPGTTGGEHAYGFVECEEMKQMYGRDVFLNSDQAQELEVGARVQFEVKLNNRGMPQAHNLTKLNGST